MAKPSKRQRGAGRRTLKKAKVGDLIARADEPGVAKGGAVTARAVAPPAVYQHNQTDLEFLR
jgi:hypothetical protein